MEVKRGVELGSYHEGVAESNLGHLTLVHLFFNGARSMVTKQKRVSRNYKCRMRGNNDSRAKPKPS